MTLFNLTSREWRNLALVLAAMLVLVDFRMYVASVVVDAVLLVGAWIALNKHLDEMDNEAAAEFEEAVNSQRYAGPAEDK